MRPLLMPIADAPLLVVEGEVKALVVADVHLGLEYELWLGGASVPSQTKRLKDMLIAHIRATRPDRLILLGDVKHNVPRTSWQERSEVPAFIEDLQEMVELDVVPGNHDGGLADLLPRKTGLMPPTGFVLDEVGYFHGHTWPDKALFRAEKLVAAHLHPTVRLTDPLGHSTVERAWVRSPVSREKLCKHYGDDLPAPEQMPELIVLPAFNDLCGGLPLNATGGDRGPIPKMADLARSRLYLLDGTDLGELNRIAARDKSRDQKAPGKGRLGERGRETVIFPADGFSTGDDSHER